MPSRVIRDGILESVPVNSLSWEAELFYRHLMSVVDDFGRYNALPTLLRSRCYPLQFERVKDAQVSKWIKECAQAGLLLPYKVDGKPYLEVQNFNQRTRQMHSKFPSPDECNTNASKTRDKVYKALPCAHEDEDEVEDEDDSRAAHGKSRSKRLPKGWAPNDAHKKIAKENRVDLALAEKIFRDWAKGGDKKYVDWDAVFRNGLRDWLKPKAPAARAVATDATGETLKRWK